MNIYYDWSPSCNTLIYCRFAPVSSDADVTLYWIRTNAQGSDNAAIQNTALDTQYR